MQCVSILKLNIIYIIIMIYHLASGRMNLPITHRFFKSSKCYFFACFFVSCRERRIFFKKAHVNCFSKKMCSCLSNYKECIRAKKLNNECKLNVWNLTMNESLNIRKLIFYEFFTLNSNWHKIIMSSFLKYNSVFMYYKIQNPMIHSIAMIANEMSWFVIYAECHQMWSGITLGRY